MFKRALKKQTFSVMKQTETLHRCLGDLLETFRAVFNLSHLVFVSRDVKQTPDYPGGFEY